MRSRSKATAEAAVVAEAARAISAAAAEVSAAAAAAAAAASAAEKESYLARSREECNESYSEREARLVSNAIKSAIYHTHLRIAISVQQSQSLSLGERIELILLQISGLYEGDFRRSGIPIEEAESIAAEAASLAVEDDLAIIHIVFSLRILVPPKFFFKVIVRKSRRSKSLYSAIQGLQRITGVNLEHMSRMPRDQTIDSILFELARYEMNVMVAELNVLLPLVTYGEATETAKDAVNVLVSVLNSFVTTVTSDPQSNASVILRLAIAAFRRVVLSYSHETQLEKETLVEELSRFELSVDDFNTWLCTQYNPRRP